MLGLFVLDATSEENFPAGDLGGCGRAVDFGVQEGQRCLK